MKTLGIILLVLLALFFGSCTLTAVYFTSMAGPTLLIVAVVAALLTVACVMGIRSLTKSDRVSPSEPPASGDDPAPPG